MGVRLPLALTATLALGGCQYVTGIVASFDDGQLVFQAEQEGWSLLAPDVCVTALAVQSADPRAGGVAPPEGNWLGGEVPPLVWSFQRAERGSNRCIAEFPVRYGDAPAGARVTVPARPLRPDIVYEIVASAPGVHAFGRFRLRRAVRVENLKS